MTRKILNFLILFFEPSFLISRNDWREKWNREIYAERLLWGRVFCLGIAVISLLHYPLIDIPAKKEPLALWFQYRVSVALVSAAAFGFSWHKKVQDTFLNSVLVYLAAGFTVYMQSRSMIWRPQVPFFYVPLLVIIGTISLRLSPGKSAIAALVMLLPVYDAFLERPDDAHHFFSASIVCIGMSIVLRFSMKTEVKAAVLEGEQLEANQNFIKTQIEMNEQIRSFLPKTIYRRVSELIKYKRYSPLQAADEVLRPKKTTGAVWFSDIRGFTGMSKVHGDLAAIAAIIPAQKICTDSVEIYNGIPRLQGDLVYAYFDEPTRDLNAISALKAAIHVIKVTAELNSQLQDMAITRYVIITFGDLIVGNLGGNEGSRDISVIGNAANLPWRIDAITKLPKIKKLLENAPVILSQEAVDALERSGLRLNYCLAFKFSYF